MLLVVVAILCVASVPLARGRLSALAELDFRAVWAAIGAAALQVLIVNVLPGGSHGVHVALHVASYALVVLFLIANRHLVGIPIMAIGAGLNMIVIAANGGVMPAASAALRIAGIEQSEDFANSAALAHPRLLPLGDVIPIPGPWPIGNVLSVGDLLIFAGALILLHVTCRSRLATPAMRRFGTFGSAAANSSVVSHATSLVTPWAKPQRHARMTTAATPPVTSVEKEHPGGCAFRCCREIAIARPL